MKNSKYKTTEKTHRLLKILSIGILSIMIVALAIGAAGLVAAEEGDDNGDMDPYLHDGDEILIEGVSDGDEIIVELEMDDEEATADVDLSYNESYEINTTDGDEWLNVSVEEGDPFDSHTFEADPDDFEDETDTVWKSYNVTWPDGGAEEFEADVDSPDSVDLVVSMSSTTEENITNADVELDSGDGFLGGIADSEQDLLILGAGVVLLWILMSRVGEGSE